jgi:glycosyltransferase involved in cell wall biosynthesis
VSKLAKENSIIGSLKVLVIIPAYNERDSILGVVQSVKDAGYEYLVINDGSTDDTLKVLQDNDINFLDLEVNLGIGGAVQAGHKYAWTHGYDIDIQIDGDGQHDVVSIPALISCVRQGANLAIGSRFIGGGNGFQSTMMRRLGIRWLSLLIRLLTGKRILDVTSGFRACDKAAIELFSRQYPVDYPEPESIVMAQKKNLTVTEIPASMHKRQGGRSSIRALSGIYYMVKVSFAIFLVAISRPANKR